jgi:uridine kinase
MQICQPQSTRAKTLTAKKQNNAANSSIKRRSSLCGFMTIEQIAAQVYCRPPRLGATRLVAVDGPGGAGKSTFAGHLADFCGAQVLHTDDFASWDNQFDWWPRLEEQVLRPVADGQLARYQRYDWGRQKLADWCAASRDGVLILEGVSSSRAVVRDRLSVAVWVETPRHIRLARGLARDGADSIVLWKQWMTAEDRHFGAEQTREHADFIVSGMSGD